MHRLPISCLSTFQIWREHYFLLRIVEMKLWARFLWLSSCSHWPLCRALGGIEWLLFEKVVWFLLPGAQLNQCMISSAAHSLEFMAVAMKLWVYLLAQMNLSLIPANLFGTGKPLGADCYCFMCLCGSEFWMTWEYLSASIQNLIPSAKNSHFSLKCHFFLKIWKILLVPNLNKAPSLYQLLWLLSINVKVAIGYQGKKSFNFYMISWKKKLQPSFPAGGNSVLALLNLVLHRVATNIGKPVLVFVIAWLQYLMERKNNTVKNITMSRIFPLIK